MTGLSEIDRLAWEANNLAGTNKPIYLKTFCSIAWLGVLVPWAFLYIHFYSSWQQSKAILYLSLKRWHRTVLLRPVVVKKIEGHRNRTRDLVVTCHPCQQPTLNPIAYPPLKQFLSKDLSKKIASLGLEPRAEGWSGWIEPVCRDLPRMRLETLQPDFPRWRYLSPGKVPLVPMLHSLLSLLRWVLLPESRSMSSIASMEAIGALPLRSNKILLKIWSQRQAGL